MLAPRNQETSDLTLVTGARKLQLRSFEVVVAAHPTSVAASGGQCPVLDLTPVSGGMVHQLRFLEAVAAAAHPTSVAASGGRCPVLDLTLVTEGMAHQLRFLEAVAAAVHPTSVASGG